MITSLVGRPPSSAGVGLVTGRGSLSVWVTRVVTVVVVVWSAVKDVTLPGVNETIASVRCHPVAERGLVTFRIAALPGLAV